MAEGNQELISDTIHQASAFTIGSNTYTQNQHNNMARTSRKIEKRVQKEDPLGNKLWKSDGTPQWTSILVDKPEPPIADPLPQVILGLLSLAISIGRGNSSKNPIFPKASKQKQAKQASKQASKNPIFPKNRQK